MLFQHTITTVPFNSWIFKDGENKKLIWFAVIACTISFAWIKILYPLPNFMPPDSISYIEAAQKNDFINTWAIGYSKFLRLISSFSNSHITLVTLQYSFLIFSLLYFLLTIRYLFSPSKWMFRILFFISIINPLLPHIANFVSSDCLFITLSIIWFTQLAWIIYHPSIRLIFIHATILVLAFTVRYNALYYPIITLLIIGLSSLPTSKKLIGITITILPLLIFIGSTQNEYHKKTGTTQFSAFGGWQLAANALYGYAHSVPDPLHETPAHLRKLHKYVTYYMDSLRTVAFRPDAIPGVFYLWNHKSPLWIYLNANYSNDSLDVFTAWSKLAPLYSEYGRFLIARHPIQFVKYFVWPNLRKFYVPPGSFMTSYNLGRDTISQNAAKWFGLEDNKVFLKPKQKHIKIIGLTSIPIAIINLLTLLSSITFIIAGGLKQSTYHSKRIVISIMLIWLINLVFSIVSAPTELRYQIFPLSITFCFMWLFLSWLIERGLLNQTEPNNLNIYKNDSPQIVNQL